MRIGTKMNDLDLCLEVVSRSRQPIALHLALNISETVRNRGSKGPPMGNDIWGIKRSRDWWRHVTPKCAVSLRVHLGVTLRHSVRQYGRLS